MPQILKYIRKSLTKRGPSPRAGTSPRFVDLSVAGIASPVRFPIRAGIDQHRVARCGGEREFLEAFTQAVRPDDVVFDLGAQLGLFAICAAKRVSEGLVIACEPDPGLQTILRENIELNGLSNVQIIPKAVSDTTGVTTLFTDGVEGYSPSLRKQERAGACTGEALVDTITIDQLVDELRVLPTVMKVDIEGAEILALRGMSQLLQSRCRPRVIFIELHPEFLPSFASSSNECIELLESCGYQIAKRVDRANESQLIFERTTE